MLINIRAKQIADPDSMDNGARELCCGHTNNRNNCGECPKNVQLVCIKSTSPLKLTPRKEKMKTDEIQSSKVAPANASSELDKFRMALNVSEHVTDSLMRYRSKYMQLMLSNALYVNSSMGKPLDMINSVSDKILDDLLLNCVGEMELKKFTEELYKSEII